MEMKTKSISHLTAMSSIPREVVTSNRKTEKAAWLIGRRITLGYTLNAGIALRNHYLQFKFEGELLDKQKKTTKVKQQKQKFSAANLLFESGGIAKAQALTGRLSNLLCSFLVPLLQSNLIELQGHIAYDIGPLGTFQDVPLSLQIIVRSEFFELRRHGDQDLTPNSNNPESASHPSSAVTSEYLKCVEAANELLLWLAEGETALIASRSADKDQKDKETEDLSSQVEVIEDEGPQSSSSVVDLEDNKQADEFEQLITTAAGRAFTSIDFTCPLRQPAIMDGCVEMKR
jgi:hypothetical protein